jgi:amicyanin
MKSKNLVVALVVIIIAAAGIFAYMRSRPAATTTPAPAATDQPATGEQGGSAVVMKDLAFAPASITVKVGTTVTWTNQDSPEHDVASDTDSPMSGLASPLLGQGEKFSFTFTTPGTYTYHCTPHPFMHGTVIVTQ